MSRYVHGSTARNKQDITHMKGACRSETESPASVVYRNETGPSAATCELTVMQDITTTTAGSVRSVRVTHRSHLSRRRPGPGSAAAGGAVTLCTGAGRFYRRPGGRPHHHRHHRRPPRPHLLLPLPAAGTAAADTAAPDRAALYRRPARHTHHVTDRTDRPTAVSEAAESDNTWGDGNGTAADSDTQ